MLLGTPDILSLLADQPQAAILDTVGSSLTDLLLHCEESGIFFGGLPVARSHRKASTPAILKNLAGVRPKLLLSAASLANLPGSHLLELHSSEHAAAPLQYQHWLIISGSYQSLLFIPQLSAQ